MILTLPPLYQLKRQAKQLAREHDIQHAQALDAVARQHGFAAWSLLVSQSSTPSLISRLANGDLLLLGARPGHGKTRLGLQLLLGAVAEERQAALFTLEHTKAQARGHLLALDASGGDAVEVFTADDIAADYITRQLEGAQPGTVAVIDYLQLLDQRRSKPPLGEQLADLRAFARNSGVILAFIAQIDRSFHPEAEPVPTLADLRLPNPVDLGVFTKACFLHGGAVRFETLS